MGKQPVNDGLRDDFIGQAIILFECMRGDTGEFVTARTVTIEDDSTPPTKRLTIERTSQETIWWTFSFLTETPPRSVALKPSGSSNTGKVPTEFLSLSAATMTETGLIQICDEVRLQVKTK